MAISGFETLDVGGGVTATLAQLAAFYLITGDILFQLENHTGTLDPTDFI